MIKRSFVLLMLMMFPVPEVDDRAEQRSAPSAEPLEQFPEGVA
jgi:hypothetical protein